MKVDNIPGYPGYHISKRGSLYSRLKRGGWVKLKGQITNGRLQYRLTIKLNKYLGGKHHKWGIENSTQKWEKASRLVAIVYVHNPRPNTYKVVCHRDNIPTHNFYKNLYWGTQKMNIQQAVEEGRFLQCRRFGKDNPAFGKPGPMLGKTGKLHPAFGKPSKLKGKHIHSDKSRKAISDKLSGINHPNYKINENMRNKVSELRGKGYSQAKIAASIGIHQTMVSKILKVLKNG